LVGTFLAADEGAGAAHHQEGHAMNGSTKRTAQTRNRETFEASRFFKSLSKEFPRPAEGSITEAQRFLLRELANNPRPSVRPPSNDGKGSEAPAILFRRAIEKGKSEGHTEAAITWAFIEFSEKGLWLNGSRFEQAVDDNASNFEKLFDGPSWQVERRIYWDRKVFEAVSREFEQRATGEEIHIQRLTKPLWDAIARFENWLLSESRLAEPRLSQLAYAAIDLDRVLNSRRFRWGDQFVQQFKVAEVSHDRADCVADLFSQTYRGFYSLLDAMGWHALIGCGDGKIDLPAGQEPKQLAEHVERFKRRAEGLLREAANLQAASEPSGSNRAEPAGSEKCVTSKAAASASRTQDELDEIAGRIYSLLITTRKRSERKPTYDSLAFQFRVSTKTIQRWLALDCKYPVAFEGCRALWKNWDSYNPGKRAEISTSRSGRVSKTKHVSRAIDDDSEDDLE
jgi:hypothetical protein